MRARTWSRVQKEVNTKTYVTLYANDMLGRQPHEYDKYLYKACHIEKKFSRRIASPVTLSVLIRLLPQFRFVMLRFYNDSCITSANTIQGSLRISLCLMLQFLILMFIISTKCPYYIYY